MMTKCFRVLTFNLSIGGSFDLLQLYSVSFLFALLVSCETNHLERVCELVSQTGCDLDERCTLDRDGSPVCLPFSTEPLSVNAPCERSEQCPVGTGCVSQSGHAQCMLFCEVADTGEGNRLCQQSLGDQSECALSLSPRDEVGVCTAPCDPRPQSQRSIEMRPLGDGTAQDCSEGESCHLAIGAEFATCAPPGQLMEGSRCDVSASCHAGLSCILDRFGARCSALYVGAQDCPEGQVNRIVRWSRDPMTGAAYTVCRRLVDLKTRPLNGVYYQLDMTLSSGEELQQRCLSYGSAASTVSQGREMVEDELLRRDLVDELSKTLMDAQLNVSGAWVLSETEPRSASGSCQRLDLTSGSLEPTPCDLTLPSLCAFTPSTL